MFDIGLRRFARLAGLSAGLAAALVFTPTGGHKTGSDGIAAEITSGSVHEVAVDNNGKIMLGGNFALASGIRRVARVFPDGSRDTDFTFGITATVGWHAALFDQQRLSGRWLVHRGQFSVMPLAAEPAPA